MRMVEAQLLLAQAWAQYHSAAGQAASSIAANAPAEERAKANHKAEDHFNSAKAHLQHLWDCVQTIAELNEQDFGDCNSKEAV